MGVYIFIHHFYLYLIRLQGKTQDTSFYIVIVEESVNTHRDAGEAQEGRDGNLDISENSQICKILDNAGHHARH